MVKIHLVDKNGDRTGEFVSVAILSLVKANFLSSLILAIIYFGILWILDLLLDII